MKEIVVLSGKGGTGKTSITASLAVLAGNSAIIADCDVDAANMHLLLTPDFANESVFYSGELAEIDQSVCSSCGLCRKICRFDAIPFKNNQYTINPFACEGCGYCEKICPEKAITMQERISGSLYISTTRVGNTLVHARLDIGAENSGKLVAQVKNEAKRLSKELSTQYILVDGSPGIGCPVASSLAGANYVLLVVEPSVSGVHDMKRLIELLEKFKMPMGCVINKHDINPQKTEEIIEYLKSRQIAHLANIPFDPAFTKAMTEVKTMVEVDSPIKGIITQLWESIKKELN